MKIYYWSPFFTNIATIKAVINSANSFIRFSKDKSLKVSLIDSIGEWDNFENIIEIQFLRVFFFIIGNILNYNVNFFFEINYYNLLRIMY